MLHYINMITVAFVCMCKHCAQVFDALYKFVLDFFYYSQNMSALQVGLVLVTIALVTHHPYGWYCENNLELLHRSTS